MNGDIYEVHYVRFKDPHTYSSELGNFNAWPEAKAERDRIFRTFAEHVKSAWVMRTNPGLKLQPHKYGFTVRRRAPQSEKKTK